MAAHYSTEDLIEIIRLKEIEGLTHKEIAVKLDRLDKAGKAKVAGLVVDKTTAPLPSLIEDSSEPEAQPQAQTEEEALVPEQVEQLNELSKRQRVIYLTRKMKTSARNRHTFNNILDAAEQEIFLEEYFNVLREEDSITSAEEQQLFNAILHLTLALRAQAQDRACYNNSPMSGNPNATFPYVDIFKKEYHDQMKKYVDTIKTLKLSREQRLKDLQRHGTTFLDFAEKYARTDEQAQAADEIMKLEELSNEALVQLQANGWLIGGGLPNNNQPSFDGDVLLKKQKNIDQDKQAKFIGSDDATEE